MTWLIFILISVVVSSLVSILQRLMIKNDDSDPVTYSVVFQSLIGILMLGIGLYFKDINFSNLKPLLPNLALMSFLYGVALIAVFSAFKYSEASKVVVILASRALFAAIGFSLMLGDNFGSKEIFGTLLLVSGIVVVNYADFDWKIKKGDVYALIAGLCFGLANINDKFLITHMSFYTYMFLAFILPPLLIVVTKPKVALKVKSLFSAKIMQVMGSTIVLYSVSAVAFFSSLKIAASPSKVTTISLLGVILTVMLAIIILKERKHIPQKIVGAVLSMVGLYLII